MIVNAEVATDENDDLMHRARNVIALIREWINQPFRLDPLPNAPAQPEKQKGAKVTIPTFEA